MRRIAAGAFVIALGLLTTDAFMKSQDLVPLGRLLLLVVLFVSGFFWLATTRALRPFFPTVIVESRPGVGLRVLPPAGRPTKQLKREVKALVADIHAHLADKSAIPDMLAEMAKNKREANQVLTEEERNRIWDEDQKTTLLKSDEERKTNERLFGARVYRVYNECKSLGLLTDENRGYIEWATKSNHWLGEAAIRLEALILKL